MKKYTEYNQLPLVLELDEMVALFRLHSRTIQEFCQLGKIPGAKKIGRNWTISKANAIAYIDGKLIKTR